MPAEEDDFAGQTIMGSATPGVLEVVAAVIARDGRYLCCRRNANRSAGGLWEFPGGKIEPGESPEQAVIREIREELGVTVKVVRHHSTSDTVVDGQRIRLICLLCDLDGPPPTTSSDHDQLAWITADELATFSWARPDLPAVQLLQHQAGGEAR